MSAITVLPIRLFCDLAQRGTHPSDLNTGAPPVFYRGDDIEIDIGIGMDGALLVPSLSNITSVTCQLFLTENDTNAPMMSATVLAAAMNLTLTAEQWANGNTPFYHAAFVFPNSQTAISLNGQASASYWLRITLLTANTTPKNITLLDCPITILDGPISSASAPPPGNMRFWTVAGVPVLQIRNDSDGLYYTVGIENDNGVPSLYLSDTGY
jgi:hypothetical protein